jgi:transcriptional regulator with GAF, ATPase, and Fis domain
MDIPIERGRSDATIIGMNGGLRSVMRQIDLVAPTAATVLLLGETGTGKGLLARAVHDRSPRHARPFVVVDCGSLPPTLIESELFGRERGAFTGAESAQAGRFEIASGGTVFLDEIGELPADLQAKLLRVIQEGCFERLGSTRTTHVDVRIKAATNRDLGAEVRDGKFRRDLFYRLNVFPIVVPALRQRREDLPALVGHLLARLGRELSKAVSHLAPGALETLGRHSWPGNIRELENVLQRSIILSNDGVIHLSDFAGDSVMTAASSTVETADHSQTLADTQRDHLLRVLEEKGWRIEGPGGAARVLGLQPSTLRSKMRHLGVSRPRTGRTAPAQDDAQPVGCANS